jgi:DNA-binding transcriptional ArsR family regulator
VPTSASRDFIDSEMAKALTHPLRVDILGEFSKLGRGLMSASDYAHRHGLNVSYVSHHFRALEKRDLIEEVKQQTVRGAVEYLYRLKRKYIFEGEEWDGLPLPVRLGVSGRTLRNFFGAITEAVDGETFEERPTERALAWDKMVLDDDGWRKVATYFRKGIDVAMEASEESEERLAKSGEKGIPAAWGLLLLQSPEPG